METYNDLIAEVISQVEELFPWDLEEKLEASNPLLLDIREPAEFEAMHIRGSINVPRGILEQSCEWDYEETVPELVRARDKEIVIICRSGNRSILAAYTMQRLGYEHTCSLKTGLKGWSDYELPLTDLHGVAVDLEQSDAYFTPRIREEQKKPQ